MTSLPGKDITAIHNDFGIPSFSMVNTMGLEEFLECCEHSHQKGHYCFQDVVPEPKRDEGNLNLTDIRGMKTLANIQKIHPAFSNKGHQLLKLKIPVSL